MEDMFQRWRSAAGDARPWVAGSYAALACAAKKRVGPRGTCATQSNLAVGHDQTVGGASGGLDLPGERDRLLHAGNYRVESFAALPQRGSYRRRRTIGAGTATGRSRE